MISCSGSAVLPEGLLLEEQQSNNNRWSIIGAPLYLYPQKTDVTIRRLDYGREAEMMVPGSALSCSGYSEDWEETIQIQVFTA